MIKHQILLQLILLFLAGVSLSFARETEEYFYAIEQSNVVCGYAHVVLCPAKIDGRPCLQLIDSLWMQVSALGKSFEARYRFEYRIDPENNMYYYHSSDIDQGGTKLGGIMEVRGDSILIISESGEDTGRVALPPGTIRQNTRIYKHLVDFFVRDTLTRKECPVFSEVDEKINNVTYTNCGMEKLLLVGKTRDALAVESFDNTTGIKTKIWIDPVTGLLLKGSHPLRDIYLSDAGVKERITRADLNEKLLARVHKVISNPWAISYMKVKAALQPGGIRLTSKGLNIPGQTFAGTVKDNLIEGVFEINRERYDGSNAPAFPCRFSNIDSLQPYLQPSDMIESDDSSLIRKAYEITAGSADAWEAAGRLSQWVHKEIGPDIPGGVTALKTYRMKLGECGSHSNLLAAFCRAIGIPARCVFGCMYVPNLGGAFGQHAWNEIYMGEAGWIQVDCTVDEITYADCGHIRLGEWISKAIMLNAKKMEILDYRLAAAVSDTGNEIAAQARYAPYVGKYQAEQGVLTVLVQEGGLDLDIPGRMIFGLKDPDENGNWFFKLTEAVSVSFVLDSSGASAALILSERQRFPKLSAGDSIQTDSLVPDEYRSLIGAYAVPMQNAKMSIESFDGHLALRLPDDRTVPLDKDETVDQWLGAINQSTKLAISFDIQASNQVSAMNLNKLTRCPKVESSLSE
jgi:Transglutaminase-like superfamily